MHPMQDDEDMELAELQELKEAAKQGMAKDFRSEMGKGEPPAASEDHQMVPGSEDDPAEGGSCEMCKGAGCEACAGGAGGGEAELDPALLAKILASLKG